MLGVYPRSCPCRMTSRIVCCEDENKHKETQERCLKHRSSVSLTLCVWKMKISCIWNQVVKTTERRFKTTIATTYELCIYVGDTISHGTLAFIDRIYAIEANYPTETITRLRGKFNQYSSTARLIASSPSVKWEFVWEIKSLYGK